MSITNLTQSCVNETAANRIMHLSKALLLLENVFFQLVFVSEIDVIHNVALDEQCTEGYFRCHDTSTTCLAQRHWCDDVAECDHGEDESTKSCGE